MRRFPGPREKPKQLDFEHFPFRAQIFQSFAVQFKRQFRIKPGTW